MNHDLQSENKMSNSRGTFESLPTQSTSQTDSPFTAVSSLGNAVESPLKAAAGHDSPFSVVGESTATDTTWPVRMPETAEMKSPFQVADAVESFGFEAASFTKLESSFATPASASGALPFTIPSVFADSTFAAEAAVSPSNATQAAIAAFGKIEASANVGQPSISKPAVAVYTPVQPAIVAKEAAAFVPAPQQAYASDEGSFDSNHSDSYSIRQLELRAIFGVDREMNVEEILQRSRALPGMRNIARVNPKDMAALEGMKQLLPNLGFGGGGLRIYAGSVPLDFIREGSVMLAVQTDGGFAPGVRETLMLVARELGRIS